jgi:hypothetical protein
LDIKKPWNRNLPQDCQKFAGAPLKKSPSALYTSVVNKLVMTPENAINAQELQLNALSAIHERTLIDNGLL